MSGSSGLGDGAHFKMHKVAASIPAQLFHIANYVVCDILSPFLLSFHGSDIKPCPRPNEITHMKTKGPIFKDSNKLCTIPPSGHTEADSAPHNDGNHLKVYKNMLQVLT